MKAAGGVPPGSLWERLKVKKLEEYHFVLKDNFHEFILAPCEIAKCLCFADKHGAILLSKEKW